MIKNLNTPLVFEKVLKVKNCRFYHNYSRFEPMRKELRKIDFKQYLPYELTVLSDINHTHYFMVNTIEFWQVYSKKDWASILVELQNSEKGLIGCLSFMYKYIQINLLPLFASLKVANKNLQEHVLWFLTANQTQLVHYKVKDSRLLKRFKVGKEMASAIQQRLTKEGIPKAENIRVYTERRNRQLMAVRKPLIDKQMLQVSTEDIPFSKLSKLPQTKLDLSKRGLSKLSPEIGQLLRMEELLLYGNHLEGLPAELWKLPNLQRVQLEGNLITDLSIPKLSESTLQELYLNGNKLTNIPAEIGLLDNLIELDFANNQLISLPSEIGKLTKVHTLYLSNNNITHLPPEIGKMTNLRVLLLAENQLKALPADIGQLQNLEVLHLMENQVTHLPLEIQNLSNLKKIVLEGNPIAEEEQAKIRQWLPNCSISMFRKQIWARHLKRLKSGYYDD
ncbi:leucine-rich repeat domain-containing protein [uncultured Microscilla sp.]|uniref:leucine-rich repeat domain-containing protein n=1 Tax=uncultured Microscilla sp. TaxID=432653 RepID=UPI002613CD7D|nr:leucine-rich repeat domain-containing protein [uncultured Microscilla sp.]